MIKGRDDTRPLFTDHYISITNLTKTLNTINSADVNAD